MPAHAIRLRGGWESSEADDPTSAATPLDLPISWPPRLAPRRLRLVRRFGSPAADQVQLSLEAVDGLRAATLNGVPIALPPGPADAYIVELPPLRDRNVLTLEVDLDGPTIEPSAPWGRITLIVD